MRERETPFELLSHYEPPRPLKLSPSLPGFAAEGTGWKWSLPEPLIVLILENDASRLSVGSVGLEEEDFRRLVAQVAQVNDRTDILERYQGQADRRLEEIYRRFEEASHDS